VAGLTFSSGLPDEPPAGWGFSYMDHTGGYYMAIAILAGLFWQASTGEGQWIDLSCTESGAALCGPALLDAEVNDRPLRRAGSPHSNRNPWPAMAPHGVYATEGEDNWIAVSVVDDAQWARFAEVVAEGWAAEPRWASRQQRLAQQDELDLLVGRWTAGRDRFVLAEQLRRAGVSAAPVQRPGERIDGDPTTAAWGLWPTISHQAMGQVRVDGLPVHFSETDWSMTTGGPCLGQHNEQVYSEVLGLSAHEIDELRGEGVI
jgi:crotonobetainyl-CoA:carnitine CoA-transferase CaiB-like acyl-CoA transferase